MQTDWKRMLTDSIRVHPRRWVACFHTLRSVISAKMRQIRNGMLVADPTAIAFVPTKLGAWLTKGGRKNALDDFCYSLGTVVTRRGK
jgi:hypothetical protein